MKKLTLAMLALACVSCMAGCNENYKKVGGNQMITGSRQYNYALVRSQLTGDTYYHISGWAEYGPEGGATMASGGTAAIAPYVGLELQLAVSKDVVYYWEPNLYYVLSKEYNVSWEKLAGGKMVE